MAGHLSEGKGTATGQNNKAQCDPEIPAVCSRHELYRRPCKPVAGLSQGRRANSPEGPPECMPPHSRCYSSCVPILFPGV